MPAVIVDTGPIVALLNPSDRWHEWSVEQFRGYRAPLVTCESVFSEASYIVRPHSKGREALLGLIRQGVIRIAFDLQTEVELVDRLMRRYANVPMSFADACLVRMSEINTASVVCTLDADFHVYRRNGRQRITVHVPG